MGPTRFVAELGPRALVRAPREHLPALPSAVARWLVDAGLPRHIEWDLVDIPLTTLSFERLRRPLVSAKEALAGCYWPDAPRWLATSWAIGDEMWTQSGALWVLRSNGAIVRIDVEVEPPTEVIARSPAELATAFVALHRWSTGRISIAKLAAALAPMPATRGRSSHWRALLEVLTDERPRTFQVLRTRPDLSPR